MTDLDMSKLDEIVAPSDDQLKQVETLAKRQLAAERNVEQCAAELAEAKRALTQINENLLPEAMRACGLREFTLESGEKVMIKEAIRASISEANRPAAIQWLREHNHGAIIRTKIEASFMPGDPAVDEVSNYLDAHSIEHATRNNVHPGTLSAWAREQLENGLEIPESISYYEQRISKVVK